MRMTYARLQGSEELGMPEGHSVPRTRAGGQLQSIQSCLEEVVFAIGSQDCYTQHPLLNHVTHVAENLIQYTY